MNLGLSAANLAGVAGINSPWGEVLASVYTVMGGLRAVVVTETIQSVILLVGAVSVTVLALLALPGAGIHSLADFKAAVKPGQLSMPSWSRPG